MKKREASFRIPPLKKGDSGGLKSQKSLSKSVLLTKIYVLFLIFVVFTPCLAQAGDISIDHAYLRKLTSYDTGTIHMFLRNESSKKITIKNVILDGIPLPSLGIVGINLSQDLLSDLSLPAPVQQEDERIVWYRVFPNPIPPGKVADIQIKWAYPPYKLIRVAVETNAGKELSQVIQPVNNPLRLSYVGFNDQFDRVYIYLENCGEESLKINQVFLDTEEVTSFCFKPWDIIQPNEKKCIVVNLSFSLKKGEYKAVKVTTGDDLIAAESIVKVFSDFPIGGERGGGSECVLICPTHAYGSYQNAARIAIANINTSHQRNFSIPTWMHICKAVQERGSFLFGEIPDIIITNPVDPSSSFSSGIEHSTQHLAKIMKMGCAPHPWHAVIPIVMDRRIPEFRNRYPTPEEMRLIIYYDVSRGVRGIFYRIGEARNNSGMKEEMERLNQELRLLKPYLKIGEPISLAECSNPRIEPCTIQVGYEGVVLILINHDTKSTPQGFNYNPKENFTVTLKIPRGMQIKNAYCVNGNRKTPLEFTQEDSKINFSIKRLGLTKQIVFE